MAAFIKIWTCFDGKKQLGEVAANSEADAKSQIKLRWPDTKSPEVEFKEAMTEQKKKPYSSMTITTGDPDLNIAHFNACAGTDDASFGLESDGALTEAKRYVRRYYIKPQNIFCSNKTDIIKALIDIDDKDCTIYTLNNLGDEKDVSKLTSDDIIYIYKDEILFDKNGVKVMDYDLYIKHEENRDSINTAAVSDARFNDVYHDRITDADLDDDEVTFRSHGNARKESIFMKQQTNLNENELTEAKTFAATVAEKVAKSYAAGIAPKAPQIYNVPGEDAESLLTKLADAEANGIAAANKDWEPHNDEAREKLEKNIAIYEKSIAFILSKISDLLKAAKQRYNTGSGFASADTLAYNILRLECHYASNKTKKDGTPFYINAAFRDAYVRAAKDILKRDGKITRSIYDMDEEVKRILAEHLTDDDREEIKDWFSDPATGVTSMVFKLPTITDAGSVANINFNRAKNLRDKWTRINDEFFFGRFGVRKPVENVDFTYRNANETPEKVNGSYYSYWKPACDIELAAPVSSAPNSVKQIVANAFAVSKDHDTNVDTSKNGTHLSSFYLAIALCALFGNGSEYNIDFYDNRFNKLSKAASKAAQEQQYNSTPTTASEEPATEEENPFDQHFDNADLEGNLIHESLNEAGGEGGECCICGEEYDGYGNNAEPFAHGRCCDACNLKFVIPARLAARDTESESADEADKD